MSFTPQRVFRLFGTVSSRQWKPGRTIIFCPWTFVFLLLIVTLANCHRHGSVRNTATHCNRSNFHFCLLRVLSHVSVGALSCYCPPVCLNVNRLSSCSACSLLIWNVYIYVWLDFYVVRRTKLYVPVNNCAVDSTQSNSRWIVVVCTHSLPLSLCVALLAE